MFNNLIAVRVGGGSSHESAELRLSHARALFGRLLATTVAFPLSLYAVVGMLAFAPILNGPFLADDYYVLDLVASATTWRVSLEVVSGHFFRPIFVLLYLVNYKLFGLWPLPYHLMVLAIHVANTYLVFWLARHLVGNKPRWFAFASGLLFLVFAGHSEAVSWVAAASDPLATLALLSAFVMFLSWNRAPRRWPLALGSCLLFAAALCSKETAVIYPAIVTGYVLIVGRRVTRSYLATGVYLAAIVTLTTAYLALRWAVFGTFTTYEGFGSSSGMFINQTAAFLIRSVLPAGRLATKVWVSYPWLIWTGVGVTLLGAWLARRRGSRQPIFLVLAFVASLAPALPLTISLASSESERFIYLPSVFASIICIWLLHELLRHRVAVIAGVTLIGFHFVMLQQSNLIWREAALLAEALVDRVAYQVSIDDSPSDARMFVLNLPDNLQGRYMFRRGLHERLRLLTPPLRKPLTIHAIAMTTLRSAQEEAVVTRNGAMVDIDLRAARFLDSPASPTAPYVLSDREHSRYRVSFKPAATGARLLYVSGYNIVDAGLIEPAPPSALSGIP